MVWLMIIAMFYAVPSWAFPDTSVLDTFTGTDATSPPNSNWSNTEIRQTQIGCNIRSNAVAPDNTNFNGCYWNVQTFGPDSEAYASIVNVGSTGFFAVCVRIQSPAANTTANTTDGYCVETEDATDTFSIIRIDNTIATVLGSAIASGGQVTVGDKFGIKAAGSSICAWWNDDGGGWVELGCQTDTTYTGAGYIGLYISGTTTVGGIDNFGGGTVGDGSMLMRRRNS